MKKIKVINVVGARPNFMKIAPIVREMNKYKRQIKQLLVHTGQHYDRKMSKLFFSELQIPKPNIYLGVGSGSHAEQTAKIMTAFEKVCIKHQPDYVLVVGDVNSTLACSIVAKKLCVRVIHVEAGLRSFDLTMPEEINRMVTDAITDLFFTTSTGAGNNLRKAGVPAGKIKFVGNVMIDTLLFNLPKANKHPILKRLNLSPRQYILTTLHRPSNVDDKKIISGIIAVLKNLAQNIPVIFPLHPRTRKQLRLFRLDRNLGNIVLLDPLGYFEFLKLTKDAKLVLTDSGGIQEETTVLGIPCLTLRENTERPITITQGSNRLVGNDPAKIKRFAYRELQRKTLIKRSRPKYWDGKAAKRIVTTILNIKI